MPAKIKRGDRVVVIAGKDRGKQGTVRAIVTKHDRVARRRRQHDQAPPARPQPGQASQIIEREAPIHISNVMLIDPNNNQPTRVTFRRREDGTLVRVGKRSGEDIE